MAESVDIQAARIAALIGARARAAAVRAVNHGAQRLAALARGAARSRSMSDARGRDIVQSIRTRRAQLSQAIARAEVYIDPNDEKGRIATYVHENYHGYTIRPKVKKMLYIPVSPAGRRHELYQEDAHEKKLKGWMEGGGNSGKGMPVGYWGEDNASAGVDFVLKKEAHIPPNPRAGFLTQTARLRRAEIIAVIERAYADAMREK